MVRFGIVGFGLHAVKRLMPGFARAERCEVTAISRRDPEKARESAARFGIPHACTSTEELCRLEDVDAVFVSSPDALHLPDTLTAIEAGLPVLCEKPMAMNGEEARQMVETARAAGVLLGVAQVFRFERSGNRFRERIAAGEIGRPIAARSEFFHPGDRSSRTWINDPDLACGGPIADVGVHCIDALRFVLQDEATLINTLAIEEDGVHPFESAAQLGLRFRGGVLAGVGVSARRPYRTLLEVSGDRGTLSAVDAFSVDVPVTIEFRESGSYSVADREELSNEMAYTLQVDAFAEAVKRGSPFEIPGEEGLRNQLILDAAFRSRESGRAEEVPID
jgi:1,5-anhydro-D-fructose reductase (1,5-anhydro-D-mannitol-forming)